MGSHEVQRSMSPETLRSFTQAVLRDLQALERMLAHDLFETGVRRIGAEQEFFLADPAGRPAPIALELLADLDDPRYTTELALFNLEFNMPPLVIGPDVLSQCRDILEAGVEKVRAAAGRRWTNAVLTGILPSIVQSDLDVASLTPHDRYIALNEGTMARAGGRLRLRIQGMDELLTEHESVMLEACNTSFQVHLQVEPAAFVQTYNVAQALAGPVLAACVNSPILFGRRLWAETRIALFHQSQDTRAVTSHPRELYPRVWFGNAWVRDSVVELFRENLVRHRPIIGGRMDEDPIAVLNASGVPRLGALQLHNGTVYRWNRPCYGICNGRPHLRIECRTIPAGPTIADEVANAAFWIGIVTAGVTAFDRIHERLDFDDVRANFIAAARSGLETGFVWLDGERVDAVDLLSERLFPLARDSLARLGIDSADIDRYIGIIEQRVASRQTGAAWLVRSDQALRSRATRTERMSVLVGLMTEHAVDGRPVHTWPIAAPADAARYPACFDRVEHCMTTDLLTVHEDDAVDLVAFLMNERQIRQILVENDDHRLAGIISWRSLLHRLATGELDALGNDVPVRDIMQKDVITAPPAMATVDAIRLMREHNITALPIVHNDRLVGIVSEHDFLPVVARLLEPSDRSGLHFA